MHRHKWKLLGITNKCPKCKQERTGIWGCKVPGCKKTKKEPMACSCKK